MPESYYKTFDVFKIESDGSRTMLASQPLDATNKTTGTYIATIMTNADGQIDEGYFSTDCVPGDVVEFKHASYSGVFRLTTTDTQEKAYTHLDNARVGFVVSNALTGSTPSDNAYLHIFDPAQPDLPPQYLGKVVEGVNVIPYRPPTGDARTLTAFVVSQSQKRQLTTTVPALAPSADVDIPATASGFRPLFDHISDAGNAAASLTDLYSDTLAGDTLANDKDKLILEYAGDFEENSATKRIYLYFGGTTIFSSAATAIAIENTERGRNDWHLRSVISREDVSTIRCSSTLIIGAGSHYQYYPFMQYVRVDGLTLNENNNIVLTGYGDGDGDVVARMGHGLFIPAAPVVTDVEFGGEGITFGGETVTFDP